MCLVVIMGQMKDIISFLLFTSVLNLKFLVQPLMERFTLTSSLSLNVFFCSFFFFYSFGELTRVFGAALYGRISLLKCDKERL